ncbi:unnamed protein product [Lactuca virosa]|uniref:NB-ARC domain-containing protein n=1 Tax=Lactuca virosa TaxID=75947 RepID=A0AAU9LYA2_9ASTR|nr:unnamed protein product [Lactuca virosa]
MLTTRLKKNRKKHGDVSSGRGGIRNQRKHPRGHGNAKYCTTIESSSTSSIRVTLVWLVCDVRNQRQSFAINVEGVEGSKWTEYNVNRWKAALAEVADLTGMVFSGSETEFIAEIVDTVNRKLDMKLVSTPAHLIGMDTRAVGINTWLKNEQSVANVLAICGMGGSGKTTLAQFIYNSNRQNFESSSYLEEIGKHSKQYDGLLGLQKQLLTDILGGKNIASISSVSAGTRKVEEALQVKRALIILDDIDEHDQLDALLGTRASRTPSKIIITTRLLDIHAWFRSISWRCEVQKSELLNDHESLDLLSCHAFGSKIPMEGFKDLAFQLAQYCGGNPLALKVLGSSLFSDAEEPREKNSMIDVWRSTLNSLNSMKGDLDCKIQEMARNIVLKESRDPAARSRVSQNDESYRLLRNGEGSKTIEGFSLNMQKLGEGMTSNPSTLETDSLAKMDKLKLLKLEHVELNGSYNNFSELRWLYWTNFRLKEIPSGLFGSNLVAMHMSYGWLENFEPPMVLNSLKILNLKWSFKLVSVHHLSRLPNLETLILSYCFRLSLTHVLETIRGLKKLSLLDFGGCNQSWKVGLCTTVGGMPESLLVPFPDSLKLLFLYRCSNPLTPLTNLKMLRVLDVSSCPNIKSLLCLPSTLEELCTSWCSSLKKITFDSAGFRLRKFEYLDCANLCEIQGLFKLVPLERLDEEDLGHMKWIKAYQHHGLTLIDDGVLRYGWDVHGWHIQVLYEYGIRSTYLPGIRIQSMPTPKYMSSSASLSFRVPSCPEKFKIRGLDVTSSYRRSGISFSASYKDKYTQALFAKVSNTSKGLTWMYNPVIYADPEDGRDKKDAVWLSYWPIGNILDAGDEINVSIIVGDGWMVSSCGASLVFIDDGEEEPKYYKDYKKEEEIIGGDVSEFELTTGAYYLCRRDYFKSTTPDWLNMLVGDTIPRKDLHGWRKSHQNDSKTSYMEPFAYRDDPYSD